MRRHLLRRLIPAVLAATATIGGSAIGEPAPAYAEPNSGEWDIEEYDRCMRGVDWEINSGKFSDEVIARHIASCCTETGGLLDGTGGCVAPPAEPAGVRPAPQLSLPPGGVPTLRPLAPPPASSTPPGVSRG
jgi:hypothetical protein